MTTPTHHSGRSWAYAGLIFGSTSSVAANVGHAFIRPTHAPADWKVQPGAIAWGVAVAVALLISVEVLARAEWPKTRGWRAVRYAGGTTVALVAAGTSYRHLSDLLAHWGETTPVIFGGPAIVDGLMILCSFALMIPEPDLTPTVRSPSNPIEPAPIRPDPIGARSAPDPVSAVEPNPPAPERAPTPILAPVAARSTARSVTLPTTRSRPAPATKQVTARPDDVAAARSAIASGDLDANPSADALRLHLKISPAYARATRDALTKSENTKPSPYKNPQEEPPEHQDQEPIPATTP